jgi:hypothetical protein
MKISLILLLFSSFVIGALGQDIPESAKRLCTIIISAERPTVKAGDPVLITTQVTNISHERMFEGWGPRNNLGMVDVADIFEVRDGCGKVLSRINPDPPKPRTLPFSGSGSFGIAPGQSLSYQQDFSRWYDLRQPGSYTIQASRPVSENGKDRMVHSNKITITIAN